MTYKGYTIEPATDPWELKFKWFFKYYRDGDEKINHATTIEEAKKAIDDLVFDALTCENIQRWLEGMYVTYALDTELQKNLKIKVGQAFFMVVHRGDVIYDGPSMVDAVEAYNQITQ